jgi:osmotically-inducible protein OsmY
MRTDADLQRAIEAELAWDPAVKSTAIGVAVNHGVVSLSGHIDTYAEKWAAEKALRRVPGVKAIAMELDVKLSPEHRYNDTELADAAETALVWHTMVPTDAVRVTVDHGRVTLEGEVDWDYQRRAVESAIRPLRGVVCGQPHPSAGTGAARRPRRKELAGRGESRPGGSRTVRQGLTPPDARPAHAAPGGSAHQPGPASPPGAASHRG